MSLFQVGLMLCIVMLIFLCVMSYSFFQESFNEKETKTTSARIISTRVAVNSNYLNLYQGIYHPFQTPVSYFVTFETDHHEQMELYIPDLYRHDLHIDATGELCYHDGIFLSFKKMS